jgi:hypothetical protein
MRITLGRTALLIGFGIGGASLILIAAWAFVAGAAAENGIVTVNRGLVPADILWIISTVCFVIALLIYGTTPDASSDESTNSQAETLSPS